VLPVPAPALVLALVLAGCGLTGASDTAKPADPATVRFTAVDLPPGSVPVELSAAADALLVGVRREGQPVVPGLLRRGSDGSLTELAVTAATPYGQLASWKSVASDGDRVLAVGGEHGGAHGNVRWSVWTGTTASGLTEQRQAFSTFGGWGAGDLVGAAVTPAGDALVGSWESAKTGFDVAVWTPQGATWTRQSSAGTALESSEEALPFPLTATTQGSSVLVAGWRLALDAGGRQLPVVWRSTAGNTGWTSTVLPDGGEAAAVVAARCQPAACEAAGRVDGKLALWRLAGGGWTRLPGVPPIAVGDNDRLPAPVRFDATLVQPVTDGGQVKIARLDGDRWTVLDTAGPTGRVTVAATVGNTLYVIAGPDEKSQTLWCADLASIH